jgi:hypothetical protein
MNRKRITIIIIAIGILLVTGSFFLMTATPAAAQCGSQASSCKNCHETQAQDPVNADGTAWHTQHAFGDFCYLCHAGNNQATDKVAAHTGMVSPLSDINASCKSCHPTDTLAKAQIYATTLGQVVGTGGTGTSAATLPAGSATSAPTEESSTPAPAVVVPSADMVDYSQRYDAVVLGKTPTNVGNIILIAILAVVVLGGGFFVLRREGLINVSFEDPKLLPIQEKYPADLVELLPALSKLKPASRQTLKTILAKPQAAAALLASIDTLTQIEPPQAQPADSEQDDEDPAEDQALENQEE